jgi:hypothetical protein
MTSLPAAAMLSMLLLGCAYSVKEPGSIPRESITNIRAAEIAVEAAMKRRWSEKMFTTAERTRDGWRVFVEESDGRKRKGFVVVDAAGEVVRFRAIRE